MLDRSLLVLLVLPAALLLGCPTSDGGQGDDDDDTGPTVTPDPDTNSYVPDGYRASAPERVIFLGDSITAGVGASAGSLTYPSLLVNNDEDVWGDYADTDLRGLFGDMEVVDVSVGGATTDSVLSEQLPDLSSALGASVSGESLVVITVGGNDMQANMLQILTGGDGVAAQVIDGVVDNMNEFIDYFDDANRFPDGVFVYLSNVYEPTDSFGQVDQCLFGFDIGPIMHNFDQANDAIRGVAEDRGIGMVDLRGHFMGHGWYNEDTELPWHHPEDPTRWFDDDCIHPNDRGHHELRRLFHAAIDGVPLPAEPQPE